MKIGKVLEILKIAEDDTEYSEDIFKKYEEGRQDDEIKKGDLVKDRRDWLVIADIYNHGQYTQKFHLENYLKFKLKNNKISECDEFSYSYIRNAALVLYIREVICKDDKSKLDNLYKSVKKFYRGNDWLEKINKVPNLRE